MPMPPRLTLLGAFALALMPGLSWALGLGGIRSDSALNEPFQGRIELNGIAAEELDTVKVTLASEAEFTKAGSPRPHFLTRLAFVPEVSPDGQIQLLVTSPEPIPEPYLDFLVEVTWPQGRLVKGYTVLLDPPANLKPPPGVAPLSMPVATVTTSSQAAPSEPTAPMAMPSAIQIPDPTPRTESAEALGRDRLEIASRAMLAEAQAGAGVAAPPSPPAAPEASSSIPDPDPALARVEREILAVLAASRPFMAAPGSTACARPMSPSSASAASVPGWWRPWRGAPWAT